MVNVLEEYLVKLGFQPDESSFTRFQQLLHDADTTVDRHSGGMLHSVLKAQLGIVGAFTAVSGSILGVVDKVAQADQSYRLLGLHQLMTADSARKLKLITDGLGASLEDIIWDPELHHRAEIMSADIDRITGKLSPDFERKMKAIRDIRFQFTLLGLAGKGLAMQFTEKLFDKFGTDIPAVQKKLEGLVDWAIEKSPAIADQLATTAKPILEETWQILVDIGEAGKTFGNTLVNLIGIMSGDTSIQGTTTNLEQMAKAYGHVGDAVGVMVREFNLGNKDLLHVAKAMAAVSARDWTTAANELRALDPAVDAEQESKKKQDAQWALRQDNIRRRAEREGREPTAAEGYAPARVEAPAESPSKYQQDREKWERDRINRRRSMGWWDLIKDSIDMEMHPYSESHPEPTGPPTPAKVATPVASSDLTSLIESAAQKYGIPVGLAMAQANKESWIRQTQANGQTVVSPKGAIGVFQLMPGTASDLHVDPYDAAQNVEGGAHYLRLLLDRFGGDQEKALAAYNAGPSAVEKAVKRFGDGWLSHLPQETQDYVPSIESQIEGKAEKKPAEKPWREVWRSPHADASLPERDGTLAYMQRPIAMPAANNTNSRSLTVTVGDIYVTQPNADARDIHRAVRDAIVDASAWEIQGDLMQLSAPS